MSALRKAVMTVSFAAAVALMTASSALAVFSVIETDLTGPDINGSTPRGEATVDQSSLPTPGTLDVRVKRVDVPDGTVLTVEITDCASFSGSPVVGTITITGGKGRLTTTLPAEPSACQVGHNSSIFLKSGDAVVLEGGSPWTVRRA